VAYCKQAHVGRKAISNSEESVADETSLSENLWGRIVCWHAGRQFIVRLNDGRDLRAILTLEVLQRAGMSEGPIVGARVKVKQYKHPKMHRITWLGVNISEMGDSSRA
jgi:hypothetical protein